jgi:hypothetical protein
LLVADHACTTVALVGCEDQSTRRNSVLGCGWAEKLLDNVILVRDHGPEKELRAAQPALESPQHGFRCCFTQQLCCSTLSGSLRLVGRNLGGRYARNRGCSATAAI